MTNPPVPIDHCDVPVMTALAQLRTKSAIWRRWLRTDQHHARWPQIYAMLLQDITFRTLSAAAAIDRESALHSPVIERGIVQG
jgi:hypothetical protein